MNARGNAADAAPSLSAQQQAIVELLIVQGRSYGSLADMLDTSTAVVRSLSQAVLLEVAPGPAAALDPAVRAEVGDYILGQQSAREGRATRERLRTSPAARAWAVAVVEALGAVYERGERPLIPGVSAGASSPAAEPPEPAAPAPSPASRRVRRAHTPRRRRALVLAAGGVAVLAATAVAVVLLTSGGTGKKRAAAHSSTPGKLLGVMSLTPVGTSGAQGAAAVAQFGPRYDLIVRGKFPVTPSGYRYVIWLGNSNRDAVAIGAQATDAQGNFTGAGPLPASFSHYKYIEVVLARGGARMQPVRLVAAGMLSSMRAPASTAP